MGHLLMKYIRRQRYVSTGQQAHTAQGPNSYIVKDQISFQFETLVIKMKFFLAVFLASLTACSLAVPLRKSGIMRSIRVIIYNLFNHRRGRNQP